MTNSLLTLLATAALGAPHIWTAGPLEAVSEDTTRPDDPSGYYRIYAARGEDESFQVAVRPNREETVAVSIDGGRLEAIEVKPRIARVGHVMAPAASESAAPAMELQADPLLPTRKGTAEPEKTVAFWVTYRIPRDTPPGIYDGDLEVRVGECTETVEVRAEIFPLTLPELPALPVYTPLEHHRLADTLKLAASHPEALRPAYRVLARYPFAYGAWGNASEAMPESNHPDHAYVSRYLRYGRLPVIDVGPGPISITTLAAGGLEPDVEAVSKFQAWVLGNTALGRPVVATAIDPPRDHWPEMAEWLAALGGADAPERLAALPLVPVFESHLAMWGIPHGQYHPAAQDLMSDGRSLAFEHAHEAEDVSASSEAGERHGAAYAYDGSFFTAWRPSSNGNRFRDERLTIRLAEPARLEKVNVAFPYGAVPPEPVVSVSREGESFAEVGVDWTEVETLDAYGFGWHEGRLDVPKEVAAFRLDFRSRDVEDPFAIAEVTLGATPTYPTLPPGSRTELWHFAGGSDFPGLAPGDSRAALRSLGWVCWSRSLKGIVLRGAANWPNRWSTATSLDGVPWPPLRNYSDIFFYPWQNSVLPSIRAAVLRDAVEDAAYLKAYQAWLDGGGAEALVDGRPVGPMDPGPVPGSEAVARLRTIVEGGRVAIGRTIQTGEDSE